MPHAQIVGLVLACIFISAPVVAGEETAAPSDTAHNVALVHQHLDWLVGYWVGEGLGGVAEEAWLPPRSGQMVGTFRLTVDGALQFYETLVIGAFEDGVELRLKHFDKELHSWEEKNDVTSFPFESSEPGHARFRGLEFIREGDNALRIELKLRRGEKVTTEIFHFERQELATDPGP